MNSVVNLLGPGLLLATPIAYAALGGLFTQRAGIFNIALEGFMLLAAFFSVAAAVSSGSLVVGTLVGVAAATLAATVMAFIVVGFRADEVIVGIAINVFALGLTTFLLTSFRAAGRQLELAAGYPRLRLPWLQDVPLLGPIFDRRDLLVWALIPSAIAVSLLFRRTGFGLRLKAVGEAPLAARAAGVRVASVRFVSIVISGAFAGLAGSELAIGSVHLFSENMTSGRGIIAFAAVIFGAGLVSRSVSACLLFGFAQALAGLLQIRTDFPSQFVLMVPFLLTIAAITFSDALKGRRTGRRDGAQPNPAADHRDERANVVIAGHLTIDEIRLPHGGTLRETAGGAAAYAALGAFMAQGDVVVVSRAGDDYPIDSLRQDHLDGGTVDTAAVAVVSGRSIHNIAHYGSDGSREFEVEDFDVLVDQTPTPDDLSHLRLSGRWVLIAPATLPQQLQLAKALRDAGALIALDTELHYLTEPDCVDQLRELASTVDCFLPSVEHLEHFFGTAVRNDGEALRSVVESFGCPLTIVKRGRDGAVVFGPDTRDGASVRAVPGVDVVDPTGAGDGFNGGCLVGLARGEPPITAAVTGCVAASFVVQSVGVSVPEGFSSMERAARSRQCSRSQAGPTEREELV